MDLERFGRIVLDRRIELGLSQEDVAAAGGPTDTTLGKIENCEWTPGNRKVTLRKLDAGLRWEPGSAVRTLAGGDPTPILGGVKLPPPSLGDSNPGRGLRPGSLNASVVLSHEERQMLARVRNKLVDESVSALTPEDALLLTKFVEEEELRTLHVRIDWLPRAEQLEVSALVNDLHMKIENRRIADGPGLQPGYAEPNPLPRDGITPDQLEEEDDDALSGDQTAKSDAQGEAIKVEEVPALDDDPEGGETSLLPRGIPDDGPPIRLYGERGTVLVVVEILRGEQVRKFVHGESVGVGGGAGVDALYVLATVAEQFLPGLFVDGCGSHEGGGGAAQRVLFPVGYFGGLEESPPCFLVLGWADGCAVWVVEDEVVRVVAVLLLEGCQDVVEGFDDGDGLFLGGFRFRPRPDQRPLAFVVFEAVGEVPVRAGAERDARLPARIGAVLGVAAAVNLLRLL